jgi:hypothetical protein
LWFLDGYSGALCKFGAAIGLCSIGGWLVHEKTLRDPPLGVREVTFWWPPLLGEEMSKIGELLPTKELRMDFVNARRLFGRRPRMCLMPKEMDLATAAREIKWELLAGPDHGGELQVADC